MYTLKKSLGQHFLKDADVVEKIVSALHPGSIKNLLEVGPGGGALTGKLLAIPGINFKAVELDKEKVDWLLKSFPSLQGRLIHQDFLEMSVPFDDDFAVIGNFPYNISSQILFKILDWYEQVPLAIGMFQQEVARRAAAKEGNKIYGVLSILLQYYYEVEYLFSVPNSAFIPPPKVESAVVRLIRRESLLPVKSEKAFRNLVKTAFTQRRKTLRNGVKGLIPPKELQNKLFDRRAETLSIKEFAELTFLMP